jgi:hypothetical protein
MTALRARSARALIFFSASLALLFYAFSPLFSAWFTGDDWHYLALFRHIDSVSALFTTNIAASYFYRPIALVFNWFSFEVFDLSTTAHYAVNLMLHALVGVEIFRLVCTLTGRSVTAVIAASCFLVFPVSAGTPVWFSNRFDLLATYASLAAVRNIIVWSCADSRQSSALVRTIFCLVIAIGSKETGYAAMAACAIFLLVGTTHSLKQRGALFAALLLLVGLSATARFFASDGEVPAEVKNINVLDYVQGLRIELRALYVSLTQHLIASVTLFSALFVAACFALRGGTRSVNTNSRLTHNTLPKHTVHATAYCLVVLLALVFILQSPISKLAFPESTHVVLVSYRLFYMPLAVISVLIAATFARRFRGSDSRWYVPMFALFSVALVAMAYETSKQNAQWRDKTNFHRDATLNALAGLKSARRTVKDGGLCALRLTPSENAIFAGDIFLDLALKSHLVRGDPTVNCVTVASPPIGMNLTRISPCEKSRVAPLQSMPPELPAVSRSDTCTFYFLQ